MTTRAAKQQEDQMATLIAMLEEQKQLNLEQRERQEELAARHESRLEQLLEEQQQRYGRLAERQDRTEEQVDIVRDNLQGMKEALHVRMQVAEDSLESLRSSQVALKEDLLGEISRRVPTTVSDGETAPRTVLRPTAEEFVPQEQLSTPGTAVTVVTAADGGATRPMQRPAPYDGQTAWDAYRTQFEMLAEINHWSETEKATFLAVSLRGSTLTVLSNLPPEGRHHYATLAAALESRFGTAHQAELNRMRLRSRTRCREEGLPELAEDVERLVRLAYPEAPAEISEVLAKDQFIDALADEDIRLRIQQSRPPTLRGALETALQLESYQLASRQRTRPVREVHLEDTPEQKPISRQSQSLGDPAVPGDVMQQMQELRKLSQQCVEAIRKFGDEISRRQPKKGARRQLGLEKVICWRCKERGHYQRNCKQEESSGAAHHGDSVNSIHLPGNGQ